MPNVCVISHVVMSRFLNNNDFTTFPLALFDPLTDLQILYATLNCKGHWNDTVSHSMDS